jgi:transposase
VKIHSKAKTNEFQRVRLAEKIKSGEWSIPQGARLLGVSRKTVRKWFRRSVQGESLLDRSSRRATSPLMVSEEMKDFHPLHAPFPDDGTRISDIVHIPRSTVSRLLKVAGLGKLQNVKEVEPVVRYQAECPGDLVHIDIKKLGRIDGV